MDQNQVKDLATKVVNHLLVAFFALVVLGGLKMGWDAAPDVVDAVNVFDGDGWDAAVTTVGVPFVATLKALVVLAVGAHGFKWAHARV